MKTRNERLTSLQVSVLGNVNAGNQSFNGEVVLLKNVTSENVTVSVKLADNDAFIQTVFYPGWNPELVIAIENAPANTLQYGY